MCMMNFVSRYVCFCVYVFMYMYSCKIIHISLYIQISNEKNSTCRHQSRYKWRCWRFRFDCFLRTLTAIDRDSTIAIGPFEVIVIIILSTTQSFMDVCIAWYVHFSCFMEVTSATTVVAAARVPLDRMVTHL
jgi:hypothetical protein